MLLPDRVERETNRTGNHYDSIQRSQPLLLMGYGGRGGASVVVAGISVVAAGASVHGLNFTKVLILIEGHT